MVKAVSVQSTSTKINGQLVDVFRNLGPTNIPFSAQDELKRAVGQMAVGAVKLQGSVEHATFSKIT